MPTIPVLTPVRLARITLAGLVIAGMASSGIAMAAGWTGPSSPAPLNNTPELIWNAQETGFTPQNASFNITGSGVLGQFAAGGYDLDAGGIAITAPSLWATDFGAGNATVYNDLIVDPAAGAITLGGVRLTAWPAAGDGDITGISAGPNLVGGGDTGEISLDLSATPTVDGITVNDRVDAARLFVTNAAAIPQIDFNGDGGSELAWNGTFSRLQFAGQPHFMQGLTTQVGSTALFSGPVSVNGGYPLTSQGQVIGSSLCALSGTACNSAPHVLGQTVSAQTFCIGSDCRTAWPAGGGGGGAVSISGGTGITATPNPITGTGSIAFDQIYGDNRYVNAAGDLLMAGNYIITGGTLIANSSSGAALSGVHSGAGVGVSGTSASSNGVSGQSNGGGSGVFGQSSSGPGVRGLSSNSWGVLAQGSPGGRFLNGGGSITTDLSTGTEGLTTNARIVAPEYCIGASCITSWPAGGSGAYVLKAGDIMSGSLTINAQLNVDSGGVGPAIRGASSGERGVLGVSTSGGLAGVYGSGAGGPGVQGISNTSYGVLGQTTSGTAAGYFTRGANWTQLATATDGVATNSNITVTGSGRVTAPQYCIGASCITSWPGGGSTSITGGTGVVVTPSPITGTGSVAVDTTYLDNRYVNETGDTMDGVFTMNSTSGFSTLEVNNTGSGRAARFQSATTNTVVSQNSSASGAAGYFSNGSGLYTYIAWGGSYGVYTTGSVTAGSFSTTGNVSATSLTLDGVTWPSLPQYTTVTQDYITLPINGWQNSPSSCPAGYKVTGVACFQWDYPAGGQYVGCVTKGSADTARVQLYGQGTRRLTYTLYCVSVL